MKHLAIKKNGRRASAQRPELSTGTGSARPLAQFSRDHAGPKTEGEESYVHNAI